MNCRIDPVSLRLFVAVCEEGSIARAAEREFIAASAISKRIAEMEAWVGTPLLSRGQRGVCTTAAGETLLRQARHILRSMSRLQDELKEYAQGTRGHVRIQANISSISGWLPEALADFVHANPHIRVDLEERSSVEVVRGVEEGQAEIGICRASVPLRELQTFAFGSSRFVVVVNEQHPLAGRDSVDFHEALDYALIGVKLHTWADSSVHALMHQVAIAHGRELRQRMQVPGYDVALRLLRNGLALSVLPHEAVKHLLALYRLKAVPLNDAWATHGLVICIAGPAALSPSASQVLAHLKSAYEGFPLACPSKMESTTNSCLPD